jgi:hypothetical protein
VSTGPKPTIATKPMPADRARALANMHRVIVEVVPLVWDANAPYGSAHAGAEGPVRAYELP